MLSISAGLSGVDRAAVLQVQRAFERLSEVSLKLSTLKRINRGSDDPAGLIGAETLNRELRALEEATEAADRSRGFVHVVDSGLSQASELLNQVEANVLAAANGAISFEERAALQLETDAALEALDRLGQSTTFAGTRVFSGEPVQVLVGPSVTDQATLNLPEVSSGSLGSPRGVLSDLRSGGAAANDAAAAQEILAGARAALLEARAEAGAFERYTLDATQRVMEDTLVNLSAAYSQISDANVATESAALLQALILADSSVVIAGLAFATHDAAVGLFDTLMS